MPNGSALRRTCQPLESLTTEEYKREALVTLVYPLFVFVFLINLILASGFGLPNFSQQQRFKPPLLLLAKPPRVTMQNGLA